MSCCDAAPHPPPPRWCLHRCPRGRSETLALNPSSTPSRYATRSPSPITATAVARACSISLRAEPVAFGHAVLVDRLQRCHFVVGGGSPRASTASAKSFPDVAMASSAPDSAGKAPPVTSVANSAEGSVKGATGYVTPAATPAAAMTPAGMGRLVPSAPSLPQVERVILELLSLPPAPVIPGSSTTCSICNQVPLPTDVLLILPVCFHMFHQSCIVTWLRNRVTPSGCPLCHAPITIPCTGQKSFTPTFCPDEYDIESQMLVPAPPGEVLAEAVGGPRGWLRSSLDRFSRSWRGCSSNRATAAVVPESSRRTTGSWSLGSSAHLGVDSHGIQKLPVPPEAAGGSRGWLRSSLATFSGSWTGFSNRRSTEIDLPVSSLPITGNLDLGPSGDRSIDIWSRSWDPEATVQELHERPSVFNYARWLFRNSG
ncbi:hypothetical protein GUJ93_ZPchr0005g14551 [Zizania palustris]|uniref:RING-type domain-containing protein n=1 Tax=Zizania palustris TaxID=103762 RepID=A0A8J5T6M1_ZIZPA|nr:hypothetical protein GUJ93_ZPchr0005g14551 [Zizania palustris]